MSGLQLFDAEVRNARADAIDVVRAVCALWVMMAHLLPWSIFTDPATAAGPAGYLAAVMRGAVWLFQPHAETNPAVLIFIVLSGYCIHRNGLRAKNANLRRYGVRRAFRILPVYLLAVVAGVVLFYLSTWLNPRIGTVLTGTSAITAEGMAVKLTGISVFVPSLHVLSFQGNAPLTTVMVEIWLYAVYGLVAALSLKWCSERWIGAMIAAIWVAGVVTVSIRPEWQGWWHNGSLAGYLAPWWIGAAVLGLKRRQALSVANVAFVGWILLTVLILAGNIQIFGVIELRKIAFAVLAAGFFVLIDQPAWHGWKPLTGMGAAGYSIYALHAPVLVVMLALGAPWWVCAMAAILAGFASYLLVEKPLIGIGKMVSP